MELFSPSAQEPHQHMQQHVQQHLQQHMQQQQQPPPPPPPPHEQRPAGHGAAVDGDFSLDNFRLPPGITLTRVQHGVQPPPSPHPQLPMRMVRPLLSSLL